MYTIYNNINMIQIGIHTRLRLEKCLTFSLPQTYLNPNNGFKTRVLVIIII